MIMEKTQKSECKNQNENAKLKKFFLFFVFVFFLLPNFALAADFVKPQTIPCVPSLPCIQEETQKSGTAVQEYVRNTFAVQFLRTFLGMAAITAVIFIIVGGLQMHLALGNEEALGKAKKTLIWAVVGLVIAILSVAIVQIVTTLPFTPPPQPPPPS